MRATVAAVLVVLLCPSITLADRHHGYRPDGSYGYDNRRYDHRSSRHHGHSDDWIVPLAIVGGILGVVALSQMNTPASAPPPPEPLCRDTYNHYDEYGNYLYSRYVDRPCY